MSEKTLILSSSLKRRILADLERGGCDGCSPTLPFGPPDADKRLFSSSAPLARIIAVMSFGTTAHARLRAAGIQTNPYRHIAATMV